MANSRKGARSPAGGPAARADAPAFPTDLDATAFAVHLQIQQINLLSIRATNRIAEKFSIDSLDMSVLLAIRREQRSRPVRPSDLWRLFDLVPSAITYRVDRLFGLGYVVRLPDPEDRRALYLKLTPKGEAAVLTVVREFNTIAVNKLSEVDKIAGGRAKLQKLLAAVLRQWQESEPAPRATAAVRPVVSRPRKKRA